jgi:hypothetical protein
MNELDAGKPKKKAELGKTCPAGKTRVGPFTRKDGSKIAPFCALAKSTRPSGERRKALEQDRAAEEAEYAAQNPGIYYPNKLNPGKKKFPATVLPTPKKGGLKGWKKDASEATRHAALLEVVREEGCATAIRKMVLIENLTTDAPTKAKLRRDREWLHGQKTCKLKSKMASTDQLDEFDASRPLEAPVKLKKPKTEKVTTAPVNVVPESRERGA